MNYLIRLEPFTSLHVWFQSGKFDKPDRLFNSISECYKSCVGSNRMDVKELIPEFFFNPEFLKNPNNLKLGTKQNKKELGVVRLPAWAKSPHDFISKNREALESEYVSENLHHWIDLIFGNKQRPPFLADGDGQSVDYCNVFPKKSYQDAYDLEKLKEENQQLYDGKSRSKSKSEM